MIYDDDYLTELPFEERINFIRSAVIEFDGRYPLYTKSEYEEWEDIYISTLAAMVTYGLQISAVAQKFRVGRFVLKKSSIV